MNEIELLTKACELAGRQIDAAAEKPSGQTACSEWNAAQLSSHLIAALGANAAMFAGV